MSERCKASLDRHSIAFPESDPTIIRLDQTEAGISRGRAPCITPGGVYWVGHHCRLLRGFECMSLQGFPFTDADSLMKITLRAFCNISPETLSVWQMLWCVWSVCFPASLSPANSRPTFRLRLLQSLLASTRLWTRTLTENFDKQQGDSDRARAGLELQLELDGGKPGCLKRLTGDGSLV